MSKTILFVKYLKNISNFINSLLEENLNKLNFKNFSNLFKNNKIILTFVAVLVIFLSYLLIPSFYTKSDISMKLETELKKKLDLNFKFSQIIKYNFFPKPHFTIKESIITNQDEEISKINELKIFISIYNLFSLEKIKIKDLIIEKANFNFNKDNYNFFLDLLNKNFKEGNLIIKKSNVFFRNFLNEVLFINKILRMKYYYEPKELVNVFYSDNEIFNVPFSIKSYFNTDKKKFFSIINLNLLKLQIENELSFDDQKKIGKSNIILNKSKRNVEYQIEKNFFNFHIFDKSEQPNKTYKGKFNLKPFYADLEGDLDEINLSYLFSSNAFIAELIKTEIFNNKNVDFKLNISANKIYNNTNFTKINLNSKIQEGLIDADNTKFSWKDFVNFEIKESLIYVKDGELVLDGKLKIIINEPNELYKFLLTPKNHRNKIKQIDLNFIYNFDDKTAELKDIKIDNKINQNVNKILNNIILKKENLRNKVYFKKLLNQAIKSYPG